ncbi:MAG: hydroxymethylbilane synthase, partial [Luteimonas sp.]|nr:hydroxymethylbilane synthase [Luteimonas sp.]
APGWLPAVAQGAIAIESRDDDTATIELLAALDHAPTRTCVEAERAMNRTLHGSCHVPVAALARLDGVGLSLEGLVGSPDDGRIVRAQGTGARADPEALGIDVARRLLAGGAAEFLPPQD